MFWSTSENEFVLVNHLCISWTDSFDDREKKHFHYCMLFYLFNHRYDCVKHPIFISWVIFLTHLYAYFHKIRYFLKSCDQRIKLVWDMKQKIFKYWRKWLNSFYNYTPKKQKFILLKSLGKLIPIWNTLWAHFLRFMISQGNH